MKNLTDVAAQNPQAQAEFFRTNWDWVYATALRILRNPVDANDVTSDVLTTFLFQRVQQLTDPERALGYLKVMTVRRALRFRQKRGIVVEPNNEAADPTIPIDMEAAGLRELLRPRLQHCLGGLTQKAQQALHLKFGGSLPNERIGELMGVSKQYIGRVITESIAALRRCLSTPRETKT